MEKSQIIQVNTNHFLAYGDIDELNRIIHEGESLEEAWARVSKEYAYLPAISDGGEYTYARLAEDVAAFRGALALHGVQKGDCVGILIPNSYAFVKAFLAVTTLGAVAVLLPPHLNEKSVYGIAAKYAFKALVYDEPTAEKVTLAGTLSLKLVKADEAKDPLPSVPCSLTDPCAVLFTGGTTGKSKGALLSHGAIMRGTVNGCYGYPGIENERYLLVLPLTHVFGLIRNLLTSLYTGSLLHICRNPKDMFREMAVFKPTTLVLVPALAEMGINLSKQLKAGANLFGGELRHIISGASNVPQHLINEYHEIGITLLAGYGLTESANLVSGNPIPLEKPHSVGLPYPKQSLRLVDGELWIKGDNLMTCYLNEEEENKTAFEDGWFKTGDLVRVDEDGFLYIVGRIKEVIVLESGEKVSPAELEVSFCAPDYINDAEVFEEVSDKGRQILTLEVVLRPGYHISKEQVIQEMNAINQTLPSHARVSKIVVRDEDFPRSPSMKKIRRVFSR